MASRRAVTALLLVQLLAFTVAAQQSSEFGRASGGEVVLTPKGSAPLSGTLTLSASNANDVFGAMTAGGTLLEDRLWFFASASRQQTSSSRFDTLALPENATSNAVGVRANAQLTSAQDFSAIFDAARRPELSTTAPASFGAVVPSSFLSLRYTGIVSSHMFFNASVSRSSRTATVPVQ
ncbi:MAG: hypothetical protein QOH21_1831 [Acidobacteriota bacterium]|jgi:hypothetical protein|nr:hypothetical protein [Acidobacteriota bacterium]